MYAYYPENLEMCCVITENNASVIAPLIISKESWDFFTSFGKLIKIQKYSSNDTIPDLLKHPKF